MTDLPLAVHQALAAHLIDGPGGLEGKHPLAAVDDPEDQLALKLSGVRGILPMDTGNRAFLWRQES